MPKEHRGFTLIELLVVLICSGILTTLFWNTFGNFLSIKNEKEKLYFENATEKIKNIQEIFLEIKNDSLPRF